MKWYDFLLVMMSAVLAILIIAVLRHSLYQDKIDHCNLRQENEDINCEYLYAERE